MTSHHSATCGKVESLSETSFYELTQLAAQLCNAPIAVLGLINQQRQYIKSMVGLGWQDSDCMLSLCAKVAQEEQILIVQDPRQHEWLSHHSLVNINIGIRFFIGIPLTSSTGKKIGALCIVDTQAHTIAGALLDGLNTLSRQLMTLYELGLQQNIIRKLAVHQENIKEQERTRIARDLHDELGQNLLALKLDLNMIQPLSSTDSKLRTHLDNALDNIDGVIDAVRNIINDLRPPVLELGLYAAIEWQLKKFERASQIRCFLETEDPTLENSLTDFQVSVLFRILQESLTNISRHANAGSVLLSLQRSEGGIEMRVSDDGIGMDPLALEKHQSFGLIGIRERLHDCHGKLLIESKPGQGTTIAAYLPFFKHPLSQRMDSLSA
jgi:signal transduction histidine kinase